MLDAALRLAETTPWAMSVLLAAALAAGVVLWRVLSQARRDAARAQGEPPAFAGAGSHRPGAPGRAPAPAKAGGEHGPADDATTTGTVLRLPRLRERTPGGPVTPEPRGPAPAAAPAGPTLVARNDAGAHGDAPGEAAPEDETPTVPTWLRPDARRVPSPPPRKRGPPLGRPAPPRDAGWTAALPGSEPMPLDDALPHLARELARHVVGIDPIYGLPWLLAIGPAEGGADAALAGAPLGRPLGAPSLPPRKRGDAPDAGLTVHVFERGVIFTVAPALLDDTLPARTAWRRLADLLRQARPDRPLDGILLFLPAHQPAPDPESDRLLGLRLAARLATLHDRLAQVLPLYVVLAGGPPPSPAMPGLDAWCAGLAPGRRNGMLGWSSPRRPDEDPPDWPAAARRAMVPPVEQSLLDAAAGSPDSDRLAASLAVPGAIEARLATLSATVDPVARPSGFAETPSLRGVWLVAPPADASAGDTAFLADLLESKVFAEASLARPTRRVARRRRVGRVALGGALAVLLVAGGVALARDVLRVRDDVDRLAPVAAQATRDLARRARHEGDDPTDVAWRRARGSELVAAMAALRPDPLETLLLPPGWTGALAAEAEAVIARALARLALPAVPEILADVALTGTPAQPPASPPPAISLTTALAPLQALAGDSEAVTKRARAYEAVRRAAHGQTIGGEATDLAAAARTALGDAWPPGAGPDDAAWRRALAGVALPPFAVGRHRPALRLAAERLGERAGAAAFAGSPVLRDVRALADRLAPILAAGPDTTPTREAVLGVVAAGDALRRSLATADTEALRAEDPVALPAVATLLERIAAADMLGEAPAERVAAALREAHAAASADLAGLAVPSLGPVVHRTADGLTIAPALDRLLAAFDDLAPFLEAPPGLDALRTLQRHRLDPDRLDAVLERVAEWRRFRGDRLDRFPPRLRPAMARLADRGLADGILAGVAAAFVPVPPGRPFDAAEAAARLAAAAPTLETLGAVLREIGAGTARARLNDWITRYAAALLEAQERG